MASSVPATARCIQIAANGGSDVLNLTQQAVGEIKLGAGEVLLKTAYAGINFIDTYFRTGLYPKPLPYVPGDEGSGTIVGAEGDDAKKLVGQRVAFFRSQGSYAQYTVTKASDVFPIPDGVSEDVAAAAILQGCTAHYLIHDCYPVTAGTKVLVHAAAGGTGLLISQMCKLKGATVIGTVGSADKAVLAQTVGKVDHVIDYKANPDWAPAVKALAPNGVDVVFDGVGKATFEAGLGVLRPRGYMVSFGNASGAVDPIAPLALSRHGSIVLQRPTLKDFSAPGEIDKRVADVFDWIKGKKLEVLIGKVFPLEDAKSAHDYLEGRASTGKILLKCQES